MHRSRVRSQGFTHVEFAIVLVVIALVGAIAIPAWLENESGANEREARKSLRRILTVNEKFRQRFHRYADNLRQLHDFDSEGVHSVIAPSDIPGYLLVYRSSGQDWSCEANPATPGVTGDRHFYMDSRGVVRFRLKGPSDSGDPEYSD